MEAIVYQQIASLEDRHWWHVARQKIICSMIDRYGPRTRGRVPGDHARPTLCDIGCGPGALLREMAKDFDVTGVDTSPIARDLCARSGIRTQDGTLPDRLQLQPESFDVVVVADVLEHVREHEPSVRTLANLLKPGGILLATVPANPWMWSKHDDAAHHQRRYTRRTLKAIFEPPVQPGLPPMPLQRELLSSYNFFLFPLIAGVRMLRLGVGDGKGSDLAPVAEPANTMLSWIFGFERHLLGRIPLPFGVSLIGVYRKLGSPGPGA